MIPWYSNVARRFLWTDFQGQSSTTKSSAKKDLVVRKVRAGNLLQNELD